ncbi:DUF1674 domain-containing protein [Peristeroidobacter soli]|uniref:DUF1674 domain-containing protein n=1 Tax=Peristeroidobacter soli TaxID=2497877 RepID=UPI00101C5BC0
MADTNSRPDSPPEADSPEPVVATATDTGTGPRPAGSAIPKEIGGRDGPEPTRFGDWEKSGRCIDF